MCVIGGLSYPSCPRCRGHAHRLPAASGAMDQTVRTAIEGRRSLRCKGTGKGENHRCTLVPVLPSMPWARPQAAGCVGSHGSDCQDGHRGAEVIAVQGDREGGKSQMHSRTCLTLDAVGTPTGCRLRREPWIRLSGRPSRGGGHCGARGQGRGKITDALSYRSCPRCRPWPSPAE